MMPFKRVKPDLQTAIQLVEKIVDLQEDLGHLPYNVGQTPPEMSEEDIKTCDEHCAELTREVHQKIGRLTQKLMDALCLPDING